MSPLLLQKPMRPIPTRPQVLARPHTSQLAWPTVSWYCPAAQRLQVALEAALVVLDRRPAGQLLHALWSIWSLYFPGGQLWHAGPAASSTNIPAGQPDTNYAGKENAMIPRVQATHASFPPLLHYTPAHPALPVLKPTLHPRKGGAYLGNFGRNAMLST